MALQEPTGVNRVDCARRPHGLVARACRKTSIRAGRAVAGQPARRLRGVQISRGHPEGDLERAHPVVRRHPLSGRDALFVNRIYTTRFEDMSVEGSRPLLEMLYRHAIRPEFCCRVHWTPGMLAIWDNRCTLHYAVNDYGKAPRRIHRVTILGESPV